MDLVCRAGFSGYGHYGIAARGRDQLARGVRGQGVACSYGSAVNRRALALAHDLSHPARCRIVLQYPQGILACTGEYYLAGGVELDRMIPLIG